LAGICNKDDLIPAAANLYRTRYQPFAEYEAAGLIHSAALARGNRRVYFLDNKEEIYGDNRGEGFLEGFTG
jgi:hypothetical protein